MTASDWNSALLWLAVVVGRETPVGFVHASVTVCLRLVLSAPPAATVWMFGAR